MARWQLLPKPAGMMFCVRWCTGTRRQWQRQKTISSSYPKAPVQESKQLLPRLHKSLHFYVNVSDFVILIVSYFALGKKYTYICVCVHMYTHSDLFRERETKLCSYLLLLFIFLFCYSLYFILWPKMLLHWHFLLHILFSLQRPIETGPFLLFSQVPCRFMVDDAKAHPQSKHLYPSWGKQGMRKDLCKDAQEPSDSLCFHHTVAQIIWLIWKHPYK